MRNKDFIAEHRGGLLSKHDHYLLVLWAANCAEHVLHSFSAISADTRPQQAIELARAWANEKISVGDARDAAFNAHSAARKIKNKSKAACAAARAAGHAVATAHMADHSLQAAAYALKSVELLGLSVADERAWQDSILSENIRDLVLRSRERKVKNYT